MKKLMGGILSIFYILAVLVSIGHAQTDIFFDGGPFYNEVIFNQNFQKGQGPFQQSVTINNTGDTVRIFLRNGGPAPQEGVDNGSVSLNGQELFNANDFKIQNGDLFAVVTKEIALLNGANTLDVELKGPGMGSINLRILRPTAFPSGTFFVVPPAAGGSDDPSCGPRTMPCATINFGIDQAAFSGGTQLLVANGVYVENVTLVDGIDVLGGFSTTFTTRDVLGTGTVIHGKGSSPTVAANSITSATLFEGFIVNGPAVTTAGGNSVAVSIANSTSALQVQNNVIVGGVAGDGIGGADGTVGISGGNGTDGGDSRNTATTISGGGGGTGGGGAGGEGGTSTQPIFDVQNGDGMTGLTSLGGAGGPGGYNGALQGPDCAFVTPNAGSVDASPGQSGGSGSNGGAGAGGIANSSTGISGTWVSANGEPGGPGSPGSGGGGGGAGGGGEFDATSTCNPAEVTGPSGGGGGAGGAGGTGGAGGQGGGGAFNIFVFNGGPTISDNLLLLGAAGNGGPGGEGGNGGSGGQGGAAGACLVFGCGQAGAGGDGGNGGPGGGGGGGAGGPSVGIYSNFTGGYDLTNTIDTSTAVSGVGGAGGQSSGNAGQAGQSGSVLAVLVE